MFDFCKFSGQLKIAAFLIIFLIFSCEKQGDVATGDILVSHEIEHYYSEDQINTKLLLASILYPDLDSIRNTTRYGVNVYKVVYRSEFMGKEQLASGLICVPDSAGSFPVLSFQNGTNTCYENTPSENSGNQLYSILAFAASSGYIVTIPDYFGFGASNEILHPYLHKKSTVRVIRDIIESAIELVESGKVKAKINGDLYLMGYSQGGWSTINALKDIEERPISSLLPIAADCGAGAYRLGRLSDEIFSLNEYQTPFYMPYFIYSRMTNNIISGSLTDYFLEPYASKIPTLFDGSYCNNDINKEFPSEVDKLIQPDFLENFETSAKFYQMRNELDSNSARVWPLNSQLRFYHSMGDKSVFPDQSIDLYNDFLLNGADARMIDLVLNPDTTLNHNDVIIPWGVDAISWINRIKKNRH
ncbi:MAG: hypothetical protein JXA77_04285 [Bacteroidales bacterium]|nr:hypothetical protein [Bacteroidales bacterium]MBN2819772.1 hypothetical protein [Bacteroidales bacterium]